MRKAMNVKRMTKKAMAMILTMSMVFGLAVTVYAEEEPAPAEEPVSAASDAIEDAIDVVAPEGEIQVVEFTPIKENLETAQTAVGNMVTTTEEGETVTDLQTADAANGAAKDELDKIDGEQIDTDTQNVKDALSAEGELNDLGDFSAASTTAQEDAGNAITNARTANTTNDRDTAYAAKDSAVANLADAEQGLKDATNAYTTASQKLDQAQDDYDKAVAAKNEADKKVKEAASALENAQNNTTAALAALSAAKENATNLAAKVQQYDKTKDELKKMQNQYYALMVQYYRELLGDDASFNPDGTLNIQACADTAAARPNDVNAKADKPNSNAVMELSRELMKQLVMYQLENTDGVDVSSIQFGLEYDQVNGKDNIKATREGIVYLNNSNQDQVLAPGERKYDNRSQQYVKNEKSKTTGSYGWFNQLVSTNDKTAVNGAGRTNRVKVVYTKKVKDEETGEMVDKEFTEYYNYIYKNSKRGDNLNDLAGGPIYLAMIKVDDKSVNRASNGENCFDDYQKLSKAIEAIQDLDNYNAALQAVTDAEAKVQAIQNEITALQGTLDANDADLQEKIGKLAALESELNAAKTTYDKAKADKAVLEAKVEEARKAVAAIDLSRFDVDDDDTTPGIPTITPAVVVTPVLPEILPVTPASGVAGVRTAAGAADAAAADAGEAVAVAGDGEEITPAAQDPVILDDELLPGAAEATSLEDDLIPGAQTVEESLSLWWLWLLILLIAIVAYSIYRYNENKRKAETVEK